MSKDNPKIALIHDYLAQYGGAEKTLEAMLEVFPEAPIFTGIYSPANMPETIRNRKIIQSKNPLFKLFTKHLSFLMPLVFEDFDLGEYDIVISDSASWAKGVITKPEQLHISYIHTPPRFLYGYSVESPARYNWFYKPVIRLIDHFLRIWDFCAAQRPDFLIANSATTKARIKKFYKREAVIIHPPLCINPVLTTQNQAKSKIVTHNPFFCCLGRLSAYKNFDLLIQTFNILGWNLVVMGTGADEKRLKRMAGKTVEFLGKVSEEEKYLVISQSQGLINPVADEDWGIVPLEAMSMGKPVLAHKSGGATENITEGVTGMFFDSLDPNSLAKSVQQFQKNIDSGMYDPQKLIAYSKNFSKEKFQKELLNFVKEKWEEHARIS